jgi:hypothetical protein
VTEPSYGASNLILYTVLFERELGDAAAARVAQRVISQHDDGFTAENMYAGIAEALGSTAKLTEACPGHAHDEQGYRDFLRRLMDRLDALRPWPQHPFVNLDVSRWHDLGDARLVARIRLTPLQTQRLLHRVFWRIGDGHEVVALRLKSGTEFALVAGWWPGSKDVALLLLDADQVPGQAVAEFRSATGLGDGQVSLIGS